MNWQQPTGNWIGIWNFMTGKGICWIVFRRNSMHSWGKCIILSVHKVFFKLYFDHIMALLDRTVRDQIWKHGWREGNLIVKLGSPEAQLCYMSVSCPRGYWLYKKVQTRFCEASIQNVFALLVKNDIHFFEFQFNSLWFFLIFSVGGNVSYLIWLLFLSNE